MYNNVIVVPLLPKIADCAQQDRVLDLTRLFPSLAVGKGSGPRDYERTTVTGNSPNTTVDCIYN